MKGVSEEEIKEDLKRIGSKEIASMVKSKAPRTSKTQKKAIFKFSKKKEEVKEIL